MISNLVMALAFLGVVLGTYLGAELTPATVRPLPDAVRERPNTNRARLHPTARMPQDPLRPTRRASRSVREGSARSSGWGSSSRRSFSGGGFSSGK